MTPAFTIYSDNPFGNPANESSRKQQRVQGWNVIDTMRGEPPGFWSDNKYEQTQHFKGTVYIAIRAVMDVLHCATVSVGQRKRNKNKATLPAGNKLTKSVSSQSSSAQSEEFQPVHDHPICRRIERPNPVDTFGQLLSYLALQNRLTGNAPLWTLPNEDGKPVELWALPTALTTPLWQRTPEYPRGAWRVQPFYASGGMGFLPGPYSGAGVIVPNEEIHRFMDPHPFFRFDGKSPLGAAAFQMDILEMIDDARWAAFDHGMMMDAVLQVDGFDEAQIERIEAKMEKRQGARNNRKFAVLSGPLGQNQKMNLTTLANSPREMDFNNSWEQMTGFVLAIFGVPKSVAGLSMASSYSELYAALRQFYQRQKAFSYRLAEFLTKALCRPYDHFPGEYRIQIDLPALDDPDLQEKQLSTDLQYDTILYNEARAIRNRPEVPGGDVPVSVFVKSATQKFAPDPQPAPGMPGDPAAGAAPVDPNAQGDDAAPDDPDTIMDGITAEALEEIGVPGTDAGADQPQPQPQPQPGQPPAKKPVPAGLAKAVPFGEAKHKRNRGQFATTGGTNAAPTRFNPVAALQAKQKQPGGTLRDPAKNAPTAPVKSRKGTATQAATTPAGQQVLARAKEWAKVQAEKHADRVAAHLGIDRTSAAFLIRTTIEHLCAQALRGNGEASQTLQQPGTGKKLTIGVRRKQNGPGQGPTAGAVPRPSNPAGQGSRPPLAKAMSAYEQSAGGSLVAPAACGPTVKLKRPKRKKKRVNYLDRLVKGLPT